MGGTLFNHEDYEWFEAHDQTSLHAQAIFDAWRDQLPAIAWTRAVVDREDGLVLYNNRGKMLHFAHAKCGYGDAGPLAAAHILSRAGFGLKSDLLTRLRSTDHLELPN